MRLEVDKWGVVSEEPVRFFFFLFQWITKYKKDHKIGDVNEKNNLSAVEYVTKLIKVDGKGGKN